MDTNDSQETTLIATKIINRLRVPFMNAPYKNSEKQYDFSRKLKNVSKNWLDVQEKIVLLATPQCSISQIGARAQITRHDFKTKLKISIVPYDPSNGKIPLPNEKINNLQNINHLSYNTSFFQFHSCGNFSEVPTTTDRIYQGLHTSERRHQSYLQIKFLDSRWEPQFPNLPQSRNHG